jgi:hypothetical protein
MTLLVDSLHKNAKLKIRFMRVQHLLITLYSYADEYVAFLRWTMSPPHALVVSFSVLLTLQLFTAAARMYVYNDNVHRQTTVAVSLWQRRGSEILMAHWQDNGVRKWPEFHKGTVYMRLCTFLLQKCSVLCIALPGRPAEERTDLSDS